MSRIERGHVDEVTVRVLRDVCRAVDMRLDLVPRWRGGDLDRLVNARHTALLDAFVRRVRRVAGWSLVPEVTFSIYGERGSVDAVLWHPATGSLVVVELKTAIVDVHDILSTLDRKRRLGGPIVAERGWRPITVSAWLVVADTVTNRRHVARHAAAFESAFDLDGRAMRRWLREPRGRVMALSFLADDRPTNARSSSRPAPRVRRPGVERT